MKNQNTFYKIYYGSYLAMVTLTTILNYVRDTKKKLSTPVQVVIILLETIILPTFTAAFIHKIKADRAERALDKAEADVVPEMATEEA